MIAHLGGVQYLPIRRRTARSDFAEETLSHLLARP
jgi:hypothetical protein